MISVYIRDRGRTAYLVNSHAVRSVRFGGNWNNGANDGFSNCNAANAPSNAYANYGADLLTCNIRHANNTACL
ncbi:MAG: hypothetical protein J5965_17625 [Aeriscardovia sp.]|nr:hypothetical protein [Aeriscardovia sp.]